MKNTKTFIKCIKRSKIMVTITICCLTILINLPITSYGEESIIRGGINAYNGKEAQSKGEAVSLEKEVKEKNYVLISSDSKEITDKELELFQKQGFYFSKYLKPNETHAWEQYKIYVYEPFLTDFLSEMKRKKYIDDVLFDKINTSTVFFNYTVWENLEKAGKISVEYDKRIPDYIKKVGYIEITSNINAKITIRENDENVYYAIYVEKEKVKKVKMKTGFYEIVCINSIEIPRNDKGLKYEDFFEITTKRTSENPYKLDIQNLVTEHRIPDYDKKKDEAYNNIIKRENSINKDKVEFIQKSITDYLSKAIMIIVLIIFSITFIIKGVVKVKENMKIRKEIQDKFNK